MARSVAAVAFRFPGPSCPSHCSHGPKRAAQTGSASGRTTPALICRTNRGNRLSPCEATPSRCVSANSVADCRARGRPRIPSPSSTRVSSATTSSNETTNHPDSRCRLTIRSCGILNRQSSICNRQFPATTRRARASNMGLDGRRLPQVLAIADDRRAVGPLDRRRLPPDESTACRAARRARCAASAAAIATDRRARFFHEHDLEACHRRVSTARGSRRPAPSVGPAGQKDAVVPPVDLLPVGVGRRAPAHGRVARQSWLEQEPRAGSRRDRRAIRRPGRSAARHGRAGPAARPGARCDDTTPSPATVTTRTPLTASTSTRRDWPERDGLQSAGSSVGARPRLRQKSLPVPLGSGRQRDRRVAQSR